MIYLVLHIEQIRDAKSDLPIDKTVGMEIETVWIAKRSNMDGFMNFFATELWQACNRKSQLFYFMVDISSTNSLVEKRN
jgi:hypothetical protein